MRALGLLELDSIAAGVRVGDAMVKSAPVDELVAGTVHPGKYLVLVVGDVASVEEALAAGREAAFSTLLDEIFLPDPHPDVHAALRGERRDGGGEAVGVVETRTVAALLGAADRGVKGAHVTLREIRVADDLGGKSYCVFRGLVADVEAAVELAVASLRSPDLLAGQVVIAQLHGEMDENLLGAPEFRLRLRGGTH
ncbi:MAG TPA: BMC domain-containing protein [Thermoanaerobaculia bacterium]|jgi:microcompartment protein CcmL/EutN